MLQKMTLLHTRKSEIKDNFGTVSRVELVSKTDFIECLSQQPFIIHSNSLVAKQKEIRFPRVLKFQIVSQRVTSIIVTFFCQLWTMINWRESNFCVFCAALLGSPICFPEMLTNKFCCLHLVRARVNDAQWVGKKAKLKTVEIVTHKTMIQWTICETYKKKVKRHKNRTVHKALALHLANLGSIPAMPWYPELPAAILSIDQGVNPDHDHLVPKQIKILDGLVREKETKLSFTL